MKKYMIPAIVLATLALTGCGQNSQLALGQGNAQANTPDSSASDIQQKLSQDLQSLQGIFNNGRQHAHLTQQQIDQINQQLNQQLNTLMGQAKQFNQHAIMHKLSHRIGLHKLPRQGDYGTQNAKDGVQVDAGDRKVSQSTLQAASQIVQQVSLPILKTNVGLPSGSTKLVLFSSKQSYAAALGQAGVPRDQLNAIVSNTGGLTIGSDIWIPLYNLQDKSDLANVLTHELTHVVLNQKGIGDTIPTWVNEGMAWHDGMQALDQVDSNKAKQESSALTQQVQDAKQNGHLLPLTASEDDILNADYNVEWTDYLAIQNLISQQGPEKMDAFLNGIAKEGVDSSFQATYNEPITQYENDFINKL
jgi:hypothetical protein